MAYGELTSKPLVLRNDDIPIPTLRDASGRVVWHSVRTWLPDNLVELS